MAGKRKRKGGGESRGIHPRNKYSDNPPDFRLLASLYPSFHPYVFFSRDGKPKIDWTDFNATRELTRVLLLHDHGLNWWIPDGQLCPTVPNRSNYIHWIEDLLASDFIEGTRPEDDVVKGFDIGTGANCIYPLLGASLLGWKFVGSDITDVAINWANQNVTSNPHVSELVEIRRVAENKTPVTERLGNMQNNGETVVSSSNEASSGLESCLSSKKSYDGPPVLLGVVKDGEKFDFCMCNPPFFETMEEAGLNPKTSCGGTPEEMVCYGGEFAFIARIIEDSIKLRDTFRWYTSMVGRKSNLNNLVSQIWSAGATIVKTTEFVQGKTSRWGLAWSFLPALRKMILPRAVENRNPSFVMEGLQRQHTAYQVLQSVESFFSMGGVSCKINSTTFSIDIAASNDQLNAIIKTNEETTSSAQAEALHFRITVFQQIPGMLLVKGTLQDRESSISGLFLSVFQLLEEFLKNKFCKGRASADGSLHKR